MRFTGFIGPSYTLSSVKVDIQRAINLYLEVDESGHGKEQEPAALLGTPGLSTLVALGNGPIRDAFVASNGTFFVVSGDTVYTVDTSWTGTALGTLFTSTGPVQMKDNGTSLFIVDGTYGYIHTLGSNVVTPVSDADFLGSNVVEYQDGYFIFIKPSSGQFYISGLNDVTFDSLDITTVEGSPDYLVSCLVDHLNLWMFGTKSIEVFYNSGNADFPFERIQGAFIEHGLAAAFSPAKMNNIVYWLGQDDKGRGIVYRAQGYQPQRISTHAVELAIQSYGTISDARAWTYQENGHHFYVLNFSNANTTWVFDEATGLWHERAYTGSSGLERHRGDCHAFFNNTHVVGDYANGNLYSLSDSVYTDAGTYITRRRIAPHVSKGMQRIKHSSLELDLESGVGLDGGVQGSDPQIMLKFSDDGGRTWSNERWVSAGKIGEYKARAKWWRLGQARDRVYWVEQTDPVKTTWIGAEINGGR